MIVASLLALAALTLYRSWGLWPYILIDVGRDLTIPGQILEGRHPYLDVQYYYPPVAPYLLALLCAVFGQSLSSFALIGLLISLVTATALYLIVRSGGSVIGAGVATMLFLAINLTGASTGNANFVFPYAHAATIGIMFVLLFTFSLHRYTFVSRHDGWFVATLLTGIAASLSKLEFAPLVVVTFLAAAVIHRFPLRRLMWAALFSTALLAAMAISFHTTEPGRHWLSDNILLSSLVSNKGARLFYAQVAGTAQAAENISRLFLSVALVAALVAMLALFDRPRSSLTLWRSRAFKLLMLMGIGALSYFLADPLFFRGWIVIELLLVAWLGLRDRRHPLLLVALPALMCAMRIALNLTPSWYGFFLIVPTYADVAWTLFIYLPERGLYSERTSRLLIPMFLMMAIGAQMQQAQVWPRRARPVTSPMGTVWETSIERSEVLQSAIDHLRARRSQSLIVFPEGVGINYLSGVPNPTRYHTFIPPVSDDAGTEGEIIQNLEETRPQHVAVFYRDTQEFGYRGFGVDYNIRLAGWIKQHYHVEKQWLRPSFYLVLMERNQPQK